MVKRVMRKTGGHILVLVKGEECPPGEICFMEDEYDWAQKLSATFQQDPESMRSFWQTLMEKKESIPGYNIFQDHPRPQNEMAQRYCRNILSDLKGRKPPEDECPPEMRNSSAS